MLYRLSILVTVSYFKKIYQDILIRSVAFSDTIEIEFS